MRRKMIGENGQSREASGVENDPLGQVNEEAARDLVGLQVYVVVDEIAKVLVTWTRDLVHEKTSEIIGKTGKQVPLAARDEIVRARAPT